MFVYSDMSALAFLSFLYPFYDVCYVILFFFPISSLAFSTIKPRSYNDADSSSEEALSAVRYHFIILARRDASKFILVKP